MGKKNRERRAAKAKTRAKARAQATSRHRGPGSRGRGSAPPGSGAADPNWSSPHGEPLYSPAQAAFGAVVFTAQHQARHGEPPPEGLRRLASLPEANLHRAVEEVLLTQVAGVWDNGWQPAELHRQARLACATAPAARLVAAATAADHLSRDPESLDPRWRDQLDQLDLPVVARRHGWVARWLRDVDLDNQRAIRAMVDAVASTWVPVLDQLIPPPGGCRTHSATQERTRPAGTTSDPILERIRGLLAKAESTGFEAEALAFTAKAQELMTRHAVDAAMVAEGTRGQGRGEGDAPVAVRVPIDAPYADAKSLLLQVVAEAGRCRAVFHNGLSMSTVAGFAGDLAGVELLFTSLLVQAQTALAAAGEAAAPGARTRRASFRSAFFVSFASRIGERLNQVNDQVFAEVEAERGGAFLPVLASRADAVDDYLDAHFGELSSGRVRAGYDAAGWARGRQAADDAQLAFADLVEAVSG